METQPLTRRAHAKINLCLQVIGKRADGYHDLRMVMQSLGLHDTLTFQRTPTQSQITLTIANHPDLPTDDSNLVVRAARRLFDLYPPDGGVAITLDKQIPVAAGLAGGSADCAAALRGIRDLFALPVDDAGLSAIGLTLGADVPYCLRGGSCLAEGIGERLTALPSMPNCVVLLAKPPIAVSTAEVFRAYGSTGKDIHNINSTEDKPSLAAMHRALSANNLPAIAYHLSNDLEHVTIAMHPVIADIKRVMLAHGAAGSLMSGSGPSVFGLFAEQDYAAAENALRRLQEMFPDMHELFLTTII